MALREPPGQNDALPRPAGQKGTDVPYRQEERIPETVTVGSQVLAAAQAMGDEEVQNVPNGERWRRASELPPDVFTVLHKPNRAIDPVVIVSTVDPDGRPRTAPSGSLRAISPRPLRLACNHHHDTYANLRRHGQVSVALLAPPSIAVSIRGRARVVKEQMDAAENLVIVEIDVEEVKNDMMRRGTIKSAIGFDPPEDLKDFYVGAIAEIEDM